MALDASAEPPVLWLSKASGGRLEPESTKQAACVVARIEDRDGKLVLAGRLAGPARMPDALVANDAWNGLSRYDGLTGERKPFPFAGIDFCFGPNGLIGPTDSQGGGLRVDAAGNVYVGLHGARRHRVCR